MDETGKILAIEIKTGKILLDETGKILLDETGKILLDKTGKILENEVETGKI